MNTHSGSKEQTLETLTIGRKMTFRKTVSEADVYLFAGITGDFHPNHVDEEYMRETVYGRRIAHGALLVGYMSTVSGRMALDVPGTVVTYGYDRIRFTKPVFFGDTVTITFEIVERDATLGKVFSRVTCTNQTGEVVCVATHILKIVE